jgi:hypothetical protein
MALYRGEFAAFQQERITGTGQESPTECLNCLKHLVTVFLECLRIVHVAVRR